MTLLLNGETFLPIQLSTAEPWAGKSVWTFARYLSFDGAHPIARNVTQRQTESGLYDFLQVRQSRPPASPDEIGLPPARTKGKFSFDKQKPAKLHCRLAPNGWILVRPQVDAKDLSWFVFDTGAPVSVIEPQVADSLNLPTVGTSVQSGGGPEIKPTVRRQATSLELGPLHIEQPVFVQMNLGLPTGTEPSIAQGVIGWDILIRCIVELDMHSESMALYSMDGYELPPHGEWRDLVLHLGHPHVQASFERNHRALFRMDSGAGGDSVIFHSPAVSKYKLLEDRATTSGESGAAGGRITFEIGQIEWFEIAGHRVAKPWVKFSTDTKGALADPNSAGNLGGAFLRPFILAFDYQNRRVGFIPRDSH